MRIALIGEGGTGKSTLAYSFSNYVVKKGLSCSIANLDVFCRHIKYAPSFDCRKAAKRRGIKPCDADKALEETYRQLLQDEALSQAQKASAVNIMDCRGGAGFFLLTSAGDFLRKRSDAAFLVCDATRGEGDYATETALAGVMQTHLKLPVITVLNKWDCVNNAPRQQTLFNEARPAAPVAGAIAASAVEGLGFREMFCAMLANKNRAEEQAVQARL
ncbi:MAG: ATP/GTP-binding protein [Candidatus Micrarchaeota archaeon]